MITDYMVISHTTASLAHGLATLALDSWFCTLASVSYYQNNMGTKPHRSSKQGHKGLFCRGSNSLWLKDKTLQVIDPGFLCGFLFYPSGV